MTRRSKPRIYWRERGGERRAYGDFRDYADIGGGREALIPVGRSQATTDAEEADVLLAERLKALDAKRRGLVFHGAALAPMLQSTSSKWLRPGSSTPAGFGSASSI